MQSGSSLRSVRKVRRRPRPLAVLAVLALGGCGGPAPVPSAAPAPVPGPSSAPPPAAPLDESTLAQPPEVEEEPPPAQAPPAPAAYAPPPPFSPAERAERFPRGDLAAARARNREGLARRAAGDAPGALAAYEEALTLSPRYVPARYNRACELARLGGEHVSAALDELETLLRLGTKDARLFVARGRFDADFDAVREEPRFEAITGSVAFDPAAAFGRQFCRDPGRVGSLIDLDRGFQLYVETETAHEDGVTLDIYAHVTGKEAYDQAIRTVGEVASYVCDPNIEYPGNLGTFRLARAGGATKCLTLRGEAEWTSQFELCLVQHDGTWRLASVAEWPDGPIDERVMRDQAASARSAKETGLARFGVTAGR